MELLSMTFVYITHTFSFTIPLTKHMIETDHNYTVLSGLELCTLVDSK